MMSFKIIIFTATFVIFHLIRVVDDIMPTFKTVMIWRFGFGDSVISIKTLLLKKHDTNNKPCYFVFFPSPFSLRFNKIIFQVKFIYTMKQFDELLLSVGVWEATVK